MAFTNRPTSRTLGRAGVYVYDWSDGTSQSDVLRRIADDLDRNDLLMSLNYENNYENGELYESFTVVVEGA